MSILDRYISSSILRTSLATLGICTLLVVAVEMFSSMNNYVTNALPFTDILYLAVLGLPEYLMMCASISFLFGTTFFLSQLESSNEMIMFLNAGLGYRRICRPIVLMILVVTILAFVFSQTIMIDAGVEHDRLSVEYFGQTSTQDSSDISVASIDGSYVVDSAYFSQDLGRLFDVTLVTRDEEGHIGGRTYASYADWSQEEGFWHLHDGLSHVVVDGIVVSSYFDELPATFMDMPPQMFTNQARDISTMDNGSALEYLERVRQVDVDLWYQAATEYVSRLFSPFSIFVLVTIALLMNYRFKKNIFLFSLIQSLCTSVIYYVVQMLTSIMCEQGIMHPAFSVIIPVVTVLVLSLAIRLIGRTHG